LRERWLARLCPESPQALNDRYALRIRVEPKELKGLPMLVMEAGRDDAAHHPASRTPRSRPSSEGEHLLLAEAPHCLLFGEPGRLDGASWRGTDVRL
jgi:alpha-beta hydrolase superfamily lysophospholipase